MYVSSIFLNSLDSNSLPLSVDMILGAPKFSMCFRSQWHSDVPLQLQTVGQLLNLSTITPNLSPSIIAKSMQMLSIGAFGSSISAGGSFAWLGALLMHQSQLSLLIGSFWPCLASTFFFRTFLALSLCSDVQHVQFCILLFVVSLVSLVFCPTSLLHLH